MLEKNEIIDALIHYKTIGVNIKILPYFFRDIINRKIKNMSSDEFYINDLWQALTIKKQIAQATVANVNQIIIDSYIAKMDERINRFGEPSDITLIITKNTTEEDLNMYFEMIDIVLEKIQIEYQETDIYTVVAKKFRVKADTSKKITNKEENEEIHYKKPLLSKEKVMFANERISKKSVSEMLDSWTPAYTGIRLTSTIEREGFAHQIE